MLTRFISSPGSSMIEYSDLRNSYFWWKTCIFSFNCVAEEFATECQKPVDGLHRLSGQIFCKKGRLDFFSPGDLYEKPCLLVIFLQHFFYKHPLSWIDIWRHQKNILGNRQMDDWNIVVSYFSS